MEKHFFRYQILRYIADLRRMEPENIGIIIQDANQDANKVSCRFHTHHGLRRGFDYGNYRRWREFFQEEINGPPVPVFQPPRSSIEFLHYLQERCSGNYSLTRPLELVLDTGDLEIAETYLFQTLVLKADDKEKTATQPVQKLRSELKQRQILIHPAFKRKELFKANGLTELVEYQYLRNHGANLPVIIQPVQILSDISRTINALERAEAIVAHIRNAKVRAHVSVVVDEIPAPSPDDSDARKWSLEQIQEGKQKMRSQDVEVVDSTPKTIQLADSIEKDLREIEPQPFK